jgi:Holliday junction resolvase RusA-like endonuclease
MHSYKVEIPEYIREVQVSKSRMKKYYEFAKKHPKAEIYKDRKKYDWKKVKGFGERKFLVDLKTGERVVANPRAAGTAKYEVINGQKIYSGMVHPTMRARIFSTLKDFLKPFMQKLPKIDAPVKIRCEIHDTIREAKSKSLWDLDNRGWPYIKAFQDLLVDLEVIHDDNVLFITGSGGIEFNPVSSNEERKLVFIIEKETDKAVIAKLNKVKDEMSRLSKRSK